MVVGCIRQSGGRSEVGWIVGEHTFILISTREPVNLLCLLGFCIILHVRPTREEEGSTREVEGGPKL